VDRLVEISSVLRRVLSIDPNGSSSNEKETGNVVEIEILDLMDMWESFCSHLLTALRSKPHSFSFGSS
jgi:hypothetical protein